MGIEVNIYFAFIYSQQLSWQQKTTAVALLRHSNAGLDTNLKIHMSTFGFLLLPGHSDEGPLDIVVDHLCPAT